MLTQLVRTLESLNAPTHKVAAKVCAFFLVAIVVSVAGQVFWRFVLLSPLIWTEKASIFALSRLVLLGFAWACLAAAIYFSATCTAACGM